MEKTILTAITTNVDNRHTYTWDVESKCIKEGNEILTNEKNDRPFYYCNTSGEIVYNKEKVKYVIDNENLIPIKVRIKNYLSTKQKIDEGDFIEFETITELKVKNKSYPVGTTIKARIETISYNKIWGVPSDLTVGNFSIDNTPLKGEINKTGANRSLWLYPTIYLTGFFFGIGFLLIPIRGGHAKIRPQQVFTVYY